MILESALIIHHKKKHAQQNILTHGVTAGIFIENKIYNGMLELIYVQDPNETIYRIPQYNGSTVIAVGARLSGSYIFKTDFDFLKGIEPVVLLSVFDSDIKTFGTKTIQILGGANFYLHEKLRARINGDLRLTKPFYTNVYNNRESRLILSIQMIF